MQGKPTLFNIVSWLRASYVDPIVTLFLKENMLFELKGYCGFIEGFFAHNVFIFKTK